ncbi:response regulator transcription factor [Azospirillum sp. B4]|uniref:response regulator transcription factor n=1 Tax=Azospirillum sp. B4 TaxID=95605 RepID=UPI0003462AFB|nr:response regulator [Azospirillum sp. B4]
MTTPGAKKLLLVEDDETLRHLLAEQLTALDEFDVFLAMDGAGALAAVAAQSFEAILLASRLPDMDGGAVCAALRADGVDCPILLMVAEGDPDVAGCSDRLVKPFRIGALLASCASTPARPVAMTRPCASGPMNSVPSPASCGPAKTARKPA